MDSETIENYIYCIKGLNRINKQNKLGIDKNSIPHMAIELAKLEQIQEINKTLKKVPSWECHIEICNAITGKLDEINDSIFELNENNFKSQTNECPNCFRPDDGKYDVCPECGFTLRGV